MGPLVNVACWQFGFRAGDHRVVIVVKHVNLTEGVQYWHVSKAAMSVAGDGSPE